MELTPRGRSATLIANAGATSAAWMQSARREGPSPQAESWLRHAFEAGLASLQRYPSLYEQQERVREDERAWLAVAEPFEPWFEYLVTFGRFAEAKDVRARAVAVLGPGLVAKVRPRIKRVLEILASMATHEVFQYALQPSFVPWLASTTGTDAGELLVSRLGGSLPFGAGPVEVVAVALPVPIYTGEPLWIAFARAPSRMAVTTSAVDPRVHLFSLEWRADEWAARPTAWSYGDVLSPRTPGPTIAPGAAPRPNLGPGSPYLAPFIGYIGQQLAPAR